MDLLVKNVKVYNSYFKKFLAADVWIRDGKFFYIDEKQTDVTPGAVVDGQDRYMVPGLIDIHMHIESSMLTPMAFSTQIAAYGVTTIVSEPHEMANVNGVAGIMDMIAAGADSPIDIYYGIPSCVPATNPELETTGGIIGCQDMMLLKELKDVICVGEIMNYRRIIEDDDLEINQFLNRLKSEDEIFPVEGHCPSLIDLDLAKFLYLGINGDHTEHSIEELKQRFANGMFVEIQDKMLNAEVVRYLIKHQLFEHFSFVTDDVMADTFITQGHLNTLVQKAIGLGMTPEQAVYSATFTPARRMNLFDRGAIAPGKLADFLLLDDLEAFQIAATYKKGQLIYQAGDDLGSLTKTGREAFPASYFNSIRLKPQTADAFCIPVNLPDGPVKVRAIAVSDGTTKTQEVILEMEVRAGRLLWENQNCLLTAVFERYGKNQNIGFGFLTGDCHKKGAVATSYAHDCHNILVAGSHIPDMVLAVNRIIKLQGGMVVTCNDNIQAELPLAIGGILYDGTAFAAGRGLAEVRTALIRQGYQHYNPIMSLGTLTLPASPSLKITDRGLIDVQKGQVVPLIIPQHG